MRLISGLVLMMSVVSFPAILIADDHGDEPEEVDRLAMYKPYEGEWVSVTKTKFINDGEVVEDEFKGKWVQQSILKGSMIEMKGSETVDGETYHYLWLYGYDPVGQTYVGWFHDERGMHAKMTGSWSAQDKKMTWTNVKEDEEAPDVTIVDDLSDLDGIRFTFKMEADGGRFQLFQDGHATRAKQ